MRRAPFKYLGAFKTDTECESACTAAGCQIWIHSHNSQHCFSRDDGYVPAAIVSSDIPRRAPRVSTVNFLTFPMPPPPPPIAVGCLSSFRCSKWELTQAVGITSGCTKSVVDCGSVTPKPGPAPPGPPTAPVYGNFDII